MKFIKANSCRISKSEMEDVLDLGFLPVSSFPLPSDPDPVQTPVKLCFSKDSGLVQLSHSVDPDAMYQQYWYMSGINQSMTDALHSIVDQAIKRVKNLSKGDVVLDIASNDGTLLSAYPTDLYRVGIDPAKNIKPKSCDLHINTYFSKSAYESSLGDKKPRIITSISMFYDLENPIEFARDVAELLDKEGLWIIELSYLPLMLERNSVDTVCAEHLEYYSLFSIEYILSRVNLAVEDVEINDVNGGSFRLYIRHKEVAQERPSVREIREKEKKLNLHSLDTYIAFRDRIEKNKKEAIEFLIEQKRLGKKVLGYGASTKGNTILAYYGIGPDLISHIADRNPIKWGRQSVTRIPIISEESAREMLPDYFFVFPYHFMSEFLSREKEFIERGGKFISPIPKLLFLP